MLVKKLKAKILALISVFFLSFSFSMAALNELGGGTASSQQSDSDSANSSVKSFAYILTALSIVETDQMSFGAFTTGSGGTITTTGGTTGDVTPIKNVADIEDAQAASITMTGDIDEDFNLKVNGGTSRSIILTHTNGTDTMTSTLIAPSNLDEDLNFGDDGSHTTTITAQLVVPGGQLSGLYSGSYNIEITYID